MRKWVRQLVTARGNARGMTLIEIMVVIFIIGLIGTMVVTSVMDQAEEAKKSKAEIDLKGFGQALDLYKLKKGRYPSTSDGLQVLVNENILKNLEQDPWKKDYVYLSPGQSNPRGYDLMSYGPDGNPGGGDDISNAAAK